MAGTVEEQERCAALQFGQERQHRVFQITGCAVNEDDWRQIGCGTCGLKAIVDASAFYIGKRADWRVQPFDARGLDAGYACEREKRGNHEPQ